MIFAIFFGLQLQPKIDSLKTLIEKEPQLNLILKLNNLYRVSDKLDSGTVVLNKYEKIVSLKDRPYVIYNIADNHLFSGRILDARSQYLRLVGGFPNSEIANDGLERLLLIESLRKDTVQLKRLTRAICLFEMKQFEPAEDSLKKLLKTNVGAYAYYYLAQLYQAKDELPLAWSALKELNQNFPKNKIYNAILLLAEIKINLDNKKEARKILEDLIIKQPTSIYAIRARSMLKKYFKD